MPHNRTELSVQAETVLRTLARLGPGFGLEVGARTEALADELVERGLAERVGRFIRVLERAGSGGSNAVPADERSRSE